MSKGNFLRRSLSSRNGLVRKGSAAVLRVPRWFAQRSARPEEFSSRPPTLVNSFPKAGTHLLMQLVEGLPERRNYGAFLASMTSSFQFRERSRGSVSNFIRSVVPGEIVRGHLFFDEASARELSERSVVHYFIYRDPRDIVVSEAHYLREMNRWHRLAPYFRKLNSIEDAISLSINGLNPAVPGIEYPNVADRFARYGGWLGREDCFTIRFEDLRSEKQASIIEQMASLYGRRVNGSIDVEACAQTMASHLDPQKSHTFRSGKKAGWQREFTAEHRRQMDEVAGELLIQMGYEPDHAWATAEQTASV
jgi:hypothetical protein